MKHVKTPIALASHFVHQRFLWFLLAGYIIAGFLPNMGLWIRTVSLGQISAFHQQTQVSLPMLMLFFLLLNAGLGVELSGLKSMKDNLKIICCGVAANIVVPLAYIFVVSHGMALWHNSEETQNILVGLALVASMPIAGSSTAWAQNANANMAISLSLVLATTFMSPLTTPLALHAVGSMTTGDFSEDLHELASQGTGMFLTLCVILPSILGIVLRLVLGKKRVTAAKPYLKLVNSTVLLLLVYSNASISLPKAIANLDLDFLAVMLTIAISLCVLTFSAGWWIGSFLNADHSQQTALTFGLGMNNNGTGLVLASMALADHPRVMLPIIMYNLVQHLVAGTVDHVLLSRGVKELPEPLAI
ncbi:MAG: bile acid:sodium symporter [Planctomycetaceae bacterium]|nr:bile acid:sodium symporter [Planctomycetaceae bacterium]